MKTLHMIFLLAVASLLFISWECGGREPARLGQALAFYHANKLDEALPLFEQLVANDNANAEYHAWLAETYRRLNRKPEAVTFARKALTLDPCNSFAHLVLAEASNPLVGMWDGANSDTTRAHAMKAVECDSTDGNPWLLVWGESIHHDEPAMMRKSLRKIVETGFLTKTALAYGRWMLRALPKNAILLTNGDMDTYPPCAVQEVEGFRKDVAIVNRGTLNEPWYARFVRDYMGVPLPYDDRQLENLRAFKDDSGNLVTPSDQIFRAWADQQAQGALNRPLVIAPTVYEEFYSLVLPRVRYAGSFLELTDEAASRAPDTESMAAGLQGVSPEEFTGPWISEQDRSPVRRVGTKNIVRNVTVAALSLSESLFNANKNSEAAKWLRWAEEVDMKSELGPVYAERIRELKKRM